MWELIAHPMRRSLLHLIREAESVTVETLAQDLINSEKYQSDGGEVPEELGYVTTVLHHNHLPKLAEAEVINYDSSKKIIEPIGNADSVYDLLDAISDDDEA